MSDGLLLFAPVGLPLAGAALTAMLRRHRHICRWTMEITVLLLAFASLQLFLKVREGYILTTRFGGWPEPFAISFRGDSFGATLVLVTGLLALAAMIYARADIGARRRHAGFDPLFLGMLAAVNGAFLTGDLFNLYVWFELMLVTALGLITLDRRREQLDGAFRYAALSMVGATFILLGIAFIFAETGVLEMVEIGKQLAGRELTLSLVTGGALIFAGFALKSGLFPLYFWLPASYPTAPITASAIFAGLLTKAGFYACVRVMVTLFGVQTLPGFPLMFALVAAGTMLMCVLGALAQTDLRRLLSWHIIAQVGYMAMGLAIASAIGIQSAIFYMVHSMIVQTNLFLVAGAMARADGTFDVRLAGGIVRSQPLLALLAAVPILSLAGIPPFSGFWAKFMVIRSSFAVGLGWLGAVALFVSLLTIISMGSVWAQAFWQSRAAGLRARRVPPAMLMAIGLLSAATLLIGLFPDTLWGIAGDAALATGARR
ncbi:MAG: proton-conducting transporter membrane subunit [Sphingomonadaceae bacterium]